MNEQEIKLMKGNEAIAHAAIRCGCDGYFGYPITPQSEIIETLAQLKPWETTGMVVLQAESEVASINMLYGGGGSGKRVMTTSSSPGIALMQEGISYMAGAEVPGVIVNVQRGGPGLGTIQPSQSDYFQATRGGGNGDYNVIVLAPNSVQEMADFVDDAFELAFKYRNPVMILSDGIIGQMMEKVVLPPFKPRKTEEEIIKECVIELESKSFLYLKDTLIADYFDFKFIQDGSITREILAEKITDYFEKVELKNNKKFEKILEFYFNHLENFVAKRVPEKTTRKNKDTMSVIVPRTKRYFEKAKQLRASKFNNVRQIIDYNRILMCLLVEIVKQNNKEVTNFDFSTRCLDEMLIIPCMESILEEDLFSIFNKKSQGIIKDKGFYSFEVCSLILSIIFLNKIKDARIIGEYSNE